VRLPRRKQGKKAQVERRISAAEVEGGKPGLHVDDLDDDTIHDEVVGLRSGDGGHLAMLVEKGSGKDVVRGQLRTRA
jgi:hypothetical protein